MSDNNPGFPHEAYIREWCATHGLNEDWMKAVFGVLYHEKMYEPRVIPTGFLRFVPIQRMSMVDGVLYAIPYMKQYENASVVTVAVEPGFESSPTPDPVRLEHAELALNISSDYKVQPDVGYGNGSFMQRTFVITPPLPDDPSSLEFSIEVKPTRNPRVHVKEVALTSATITLK